MVRHLGPHDLADGHNILAGLVVGVDLQEHQLPADESVFLQGADLDDLNKLVELLFHLLHHAVATVHNDGDAGNGGVGRSRPRPGTQC